jgi:hypothetical protein
MPRTASDSSTCRLDRGYDKYHRTSSRMTSLGRR